MPKRNDVPEEWAIAMLQKLIDLDNEQRDAIPGSVVKLVKQAQTIMKKRRRVLPESFLGLLRSRKALLP